MSLPALKVEADEPRQRLILSGGPALPAVGKRAVAIGGIVIVLIFGLPALGNLLALLRSGFSPGLFFALVASALFPLGVVAVLLAAANNVNVVTRLAFERGKGRVEIGEFRLVGGGGEPRAIRFDELSGMTIRAIRPIPTDGTPSQRFEFALRLRDRSGGWRTKRAVRFSVAGLDKKEEAGDLALRLAGVAGFEYQKVVRSDPRELELEFRTISEAGFVPVADPAGKADYQRDQVSAPAAALAARETTPPFDPRSLKADFRVETWLPGQEVRLRRPFGFAAVGCLPGVLLVFAGPAAFFLARGPSNTLGDQMLLGFVCGIFGLIFGGICAVAVYTSLPRTIVFDWTERRLKITGLLRRTEHDFTEIRGVGLMSQRMQRSQGSSRYPTYYCEVSVKLGGQGAEVTPLVLFRTESEREDPQAPYRMCLPLVSELAGALGVARDVGNYAE